MITPDPHMTKAENGWRFVTLDVFSDTPFHGNPLAVFPDAEGLADATMQSLAAEINYSETCFLLPPTDSAADARLRIFNRTAELPFAGHPTIGAATILADRLADGQTTLRIEVESGVVIAEILPSRSVGIRGASIVAPQPLSIGQQLPPKQIAACLQIAEGGIVSKQHPPIVATTGVDFIFVEVSDAALAEARPSLAAFEALRDMMAGRSKRASIYCYVRSDRSIRSRMFAPLEGTYEDPGTGSASATLGALLLSLTNASRLTLHVRQGVEMGRPCAITVDASREGGAFRAKLTGECAKVFSGRFGE